MEIDLLVAPLIGLLRLIYQYNIGPLGDASYFQFSSNPTTCMAPHATTHQHIFNTIGCRVTKSAEIACYTTSATRPHIQTAT